MVADAAFDDRPFVTALARGLQILQVFASAEERLSNTEIAKRCALPKSTVSRLTHTLTVLGYLHHLPETGRYRLGLSTLGLGRAVRDRLDLRDAASTLLQELADTTTTMVSLTIRDDFSVLYIDSCRCRTSAVTLHLDIGTRLPLVSTAAGRAHLIAAKPSVRKSLLDRMQKLDPAAWAGVVSVMEQSAQEYAESGCVTSFGEWREEINAIATPLSLGSELPLIVANVAAPAWVVSPEKFMNDIRPQLLATIRAIEKRYRPLAQR